jgi:hypothetical protein
VLLITASILATRKLAQYEREAGARDDLRNRRFYSLPSSRRSQDCAFQRKSHPKPDDCGYS